MRPWKQSGERERGRETGGQKCVSGSIWAGRVKDVTGMCQTAGHSHTLGELRKEAAWLSATGGPRQLLPCLCWCKALLKKLEMLSDQIWSEERFPRDAN